jgi:hypothetical protein
MFMVCLQANFRIFTYSSLFVIAFKVKPKHKISHGGSWPHFKFSSNSRELSNRKPSMALKGTFRQPRPERANEDPAP